MYMCVRGIHLTFVSIINLIDYWSCTGNVDYFVFHFATRVLNEFNYLLYFLSTFHCYFMAPVLHIYILNIVCM